MGEKSKDNVNSPRVNGPDYLVNKDTEADYHGFGTINSGSVSTSISTALVRSSSIIQIQERIPGSLGVGVNSGGPLVVSAVTDGTSFTVANATGVAVPWDRSFSWRLSQTTES